MHNATAAAGRAAPPTSSLSKRSGNLVNAILGSVTVNGTTFDDIPGSVGAPGIPYARIQELGGTISAKNGKFLCIPLPAALDSNGLPLKSSPRDWPNTFCAKSKAGNLLIFQQRRHVDPAALCAEDVR